MYYTAPADWATGHSFGVGVGAYTSGKMQSVCSTAPANWVKEGLEFWRKRKKN